MKTNFIVELKFKNGKKKEFQASFNQKYTKELWKQTKKKVYKLIRESFNANNALSRIANYKISVVKDMDDRLDFIVPDVLEFYDSVYDKKLPRHFKKLDLSDSREIMVRE